MISPCDEAELAEAVACATSPLLIQGGGTRGVHLQGDVLDTRGLSGVTLYEPGALTMVARAGTPLTEIEETLAAEAQRLAFEPIDMRPLLKTKGSPTIGGVFATNASGPRRISVGAARDFLLGVRFVDGQGTITKNGGRVMKNVTGYDLVKLMAGSWGTLGVLTEVSFKVLPKPETQGTILIDGLSYHGAVKAMSSALGSPYDVTGAACLGKGAQTLVRIEGNEKSVLYRLERLQKLLAGFGEISTEQNDYGRWSAVRDMAPFADEDKDIWRISVKPSDAPDVIAKLPNDTCVTLDWGGGLVWAAVSQGTDLRAKIGAFQGHATRVKGNGDIPRFHPEAPPVAVLSAMLRQKFDPKGILNQGLMGAYPQSNAGGHHGPL